MSENDPSNHVDNIVNNCRQVLFECWIYILGEILYKYYKSPAKKINFIVLLLSINEPSNNVDRNTENYKESKMYVGYK